MTEEDLSNILEPRYDVSRLSSSEQNILLDRIHEVADSTLVLVEEAQLEELSGEPRKLIDGILSHLSNLRGMEDLDDALTQMDFVDAILRGCTRPSESLRLTRLVLGPVYERYTESIVSVLDSPEYRKALAKPEFHRRDHR